ncbi:MAG: hypothetical protein M0R80_18345 [Proteobacteria bacterium]|jgi:hypothetical protein|nr:hypothetical protein [Pseudomonadota bacterium]
MIELNTIPTDRNANSYVSLAEANEYFSDFYYGDTVWSGATDTDKKSVLKMAMRIIDRFRFHGEKFDDLQVLKFPRSESDIASGTASSGGVDHIICSSLANRIEFPDDIFKYGGIEVLSGTNKWEKRQISGFVRSTGRINFLTNFSVACDDTTSFRIIDQVPLKVKHAQCEIAKWILEGKNTSSRLQLQAEGVSSFSVGDLSETYDKSVDINLIPVEAKVLLGGYISKIGSW